MNFHELDTIITRIGQDSKIIFCGDFDQTDLQRTNEINGLHNFLKILEEMDDLVYRIFYWRYSDDLDLLEVILN